MTATATPGIELPVETALREFNGKANGACRALSVADLDAGQWFHEAHGKMIFYWYDAGSTALLFDIVNRIRSTYRLRTYGCMQ